jgi:hypothetical protein
VVCSETMSKANVPSVPAARNISDTVLKESCKTIDQALARIDSLKKEMPCWLSSRSGLIADPLDFDYAGPRQTLMQARQACDVLPQLTRKAVPDEVTTQLALLSACYPHQEKGERRIFERLLCEDVADLEPSVYALDRACRRLRQRSKFHPAIAEVVDELKACIERSNCLDSCRLVCQTWKSDWIAMNRTPSGSASKKGQAVPPERAAFARPTTEAAKRGPAKPKAQHR